MIFNQKNVEYSLSPLFLLASFELKLSDKNKSANSNFEEEGCTENYFIQGRGFMGIIASFFFTDGIAYHFYLGKNRISIYPYISPFEISTPYAKYSPYSDVIGSLGFGINYFSTKHLIIEANAQFDHSLMDNSNNNGYSINISAGYRFSLNKNESNSKKWNHSNIISPFVLGY